MTPIGQDSRARTGVRRLDVTKLDVRVLRHGQEIERAVARPVRVLRASGLPEVFAGIAYSGVVFPLRPDNSVELVGPSFAKTACVGFVERGQPIPYARSENQVESAREDPADPGSHSTWSRAEISVLISSYFRMLDSEHQGVPYSKIAENRRVQKATGRSKGSIEFKFCNVSAALETLGHQHIRGYLPRRHAQRELHDAVRDYLARREIEDLATVEDRDGINSPESPSKAATKHTVGYTYTSQADDQYTVLCSCGYTAQVARWVDARRLMIDHRDSASAASPAATKDPSIGVHMQADDDFWSILRTLWDHSTGGAEVAAAPTSAVSDMKGPPAAGLQEAVDWMRHRIQSGDSRAMLFLVGGPGAGKSHATTEIVQGLDEIAAIDDGLAHRSYRFRGPSAVLRVINDATIPDEAEGRSKTLSRDVDSSIRDRENLVVCVNRGVLVEEANPNGSQDLGTVGSHVIHWLSTRDATESAPTPNLATLSEHGFIRTARLHLDNSYLDDGDVIELVAVYLDVCSLFETRPSVNLSLGDDGWQADGDHYEISPLVERRQLPIAGIPAGALASVLLERLGTAAISSGAESNPVLANIESLMPPSVRNSLLTMLRCSELASSQGFTYRELWGALSRAVLGAAPILGTMADLQQMLEEPAAANPKNRWKQMTSLADLRWTEALFNSEPSRAIRPTRDPVARLTSKADPARDALPGSLEEKRWDSGWATPVTDAFTSPEQASPLVQLLREMDDSHPFTAIVTAFDHELDQAYVAFTSPDLGLPDRQRQAAQSWYGAYLTRLYAGALGITAFRPAIAMWTTAWAFAPMLPAELEQCLLALVRPPLDPAHAGSASYLPLLESKAAPIVGDVAEPRLAIKTDQVELRTRKDSLAGLRLELYESGRKVTSIELDFTLTREALACTAGRLGMTDQSQSVSPRLERFRAARLLSANLQQAGRYVVVHRDLPFPIAVQGGE